jgi:hypothetical protein
MTVVTKVRSHKIVKESDEEDLHDLFKNFERNVSIFIYLRDT